MVSAYRVSVNSALPCIRSPESVIRRFPIPCCTQSAKRLLTAVAKARFYD